MVTRTLFAVFTALVLLAGSVASTLAADARVAGAPALNADWPTGYYLWRNDDDFHLRTHGPQARHDFVAYLTTDGQFRDVDVVRAENRDNVRLINGARTLVLHFHTYDATDGINFRVAGGSALRLDLRLDGHRISTEHIFLGAGGAHPAKNPFSVKL